MSGAGSQCYSIRQRITRACPCARAVHIQPNEHKGSVFLTVNTTGHFRLWHRAGDVCSAAVAQPAALPAQRRVKSKAQTLAELAEENDWKNDVVLFWLPQEFRCAADPALPWARG